MTKIFAMLKEKKSVNCTVLSQEFECCTKTIQRDIDYMRDQVGLPIEFDFGLKAYRLIDDASILPWWLKTTQEVERKHYIFLRLKPGGHQVQVRQVGSSNEWDNWEALERRADDEVNLQEGISTGRLIAL